MKVELGWAAPTISEQFPQLTNKDADQFQRDHMDLSRLKIRGLLTHSEHQKAVTRFAKNLSAVLAAIRARNEIPD